MYAHAATASPPAPVPITKPDAKTVSDGAIPPPPPPLANPRVDVSVTPNPNSSINAGHCAKVGKAVEKEVKRAIEHAAPEGAPAQLDKAIRTAQEEIKKIDPGSIKEVKVKVSGTEGGKPVKQEVTVPTAPAK